MVVYGLVDDMYYFIGEGLYWGPLLEKGYHGTVFAGHMGEFGKAARVRENAAVEDETATVA